MMSSKPKWLKILQIVFCVIMSILCCVAVVLCALAYALNKPKLDIGCVVVAGLVVVLTIAYAIVVSKLKVKF